MQDREVQLLEHAVEVEQPARPGLLDLSLGELSADDLDDFGEACEDLIERLAPWNWSKDD